MGQKISIIRQRTIYIAFVCAFLLAGALAIAHSASRANRRLPGITPTTNPAAPVLHSQNRLEAERITLRPSGFEPEQITRPAGRFLLAINNRSGKEDVTLLLVRGGADLLNEVRMRELARKYQWRQVLNLPAGHYELREADHPEWVCQITLTGSTYKSKIEGGPGKTRI